jgi:hypothetical protein
MNTDNNAEAAPLEDLPLVEVVTNRDGVVVKWGRDGTTAPHATLYADAPYLFSAFDSNGDEPFIKTFGSLPHCDGGVLTIGQDRFRIRAQQQPNGSSLCKSDWWYRQ